MNHPFVQLTLLVAAVVLSGCRCQTNNESSNGFDYKVLIEKIEYLEKTLNETQAKIMMEGEMIRRELQEFKSEFNVISSCRKAPADKSGIYKLKIMNTAFDVYCEQNLYGGGWIVIQNRFNGFVDFYRGWTAYRNGFGSLDGEFWIGLEIIQSLTSSRNYELMVHLEDFDGVVKYAQYNTFEIGGEQEDYALRNTLDAYNGTAENSLRRHYGDKFCTRDRDNDKDYYRNLANVYHAGWWFHTEDLEETNLNGEYKNAEGDRTMHWLGFHGNRQGLKVSKMMIREKDIHNMISVVVKEEMD